MPVMGVVGLWSGRDVPKSERAYELNGGGSTVRSSSWSSMRLKGMARGRLDSAVMSVRGAIAIESRRGRRAGLAGPCRGLVTLCVLAAARLDAFAWRLN